MFSIIDSGPNLMNLSYVAELPTPGSNLKKLRGVELVIQDLNRWHVVQRYLQCIKFDSSRQKILKIGQDRCFLPQSLFCHLKVNLFSPIKRIKP